MVKNSKVKTIEGSITLTIIWVIICLLLFICILLPLLFVLASPSLSDFKKVLFSSIWKKACLNTFIEVLASTFFSVLTGFLYAYGVVKVSIPAKKFFSLIPLIHLVTPPFVGGLAFILLLGKQGFITKTILGLDISLYGFPGLLIAQTLCFFPLAYMICAQTLENINSDYEIAARTLNAGRLKIFFTITLPLSMPGIISAALYIAVSVMSDFGNPMIVAGRFRVLAVEIYTQLTGWINGGSSAVLGILLVIPSIILFVFQNKYFSKNMAKLAVVGGKASSNTKSSASVAAKIFFTIFCSFITICVILQFFAIIAGSFQKIWGINPEFTLKHIQNIARCKKELINSLRFAIEAGLLSTLIASLAAFLVLRTSCPLKKYIDSLIQLPAAIPGSLFGLALLLFSSKINFHYSNILILIAITVGFIPFSYRSISSAYSQIKMTIDDAALALGSSPLKLLFSIIYPLSKDGLLNSFIYDFMRGVGTMSAVIFLVSFDTPLTSIKILNLAEQGFWGDAAALALVLTIITFVILLTGKLIIRFWGKKYE